MKPPSRRLSLINHLSRFFSSQFLKMDVLYKTSLRFSYCQIYHGSLGAVAVAVRNISSSSANFASAGKLSSRTWIKLFFCSRSTTHCNLLTQEWHTSVEFNCLGGWSFMIGYSKNLSRSMYALLLHAAETLISFGSLGQWLLCDLSFSDRETRGVVLKL